jgi:hypothetical protein
MAEDDLPPAPSQSPEVVDPHNVQTLFVDWIVTAGESENVVNFTFGTIDHSLKKSEDDLARIVIATRLRMSREFAIRFHDFLGTVLKAVPPDASPMSGPLMPPKNLIN